MLDQNTFTETIREVAEIIRTSPEPMTREEILSYFSDMELNDEQVNMVLEFLLTPHEDPVEEESEDEEEDETAKDADFDTETSLDLDEVFGDKKQPEKSKKDCVPDSKVFQMYLEELAQLPAYEEENVKQMYQELLEGEQEAVVRLTNGWMRRVLEIAKNLADSPEGFEDVVQEGNMALFLKLTELCGCGQKLDVEAVLEETVMNAMKQCISELAGEDDDENAIVGKVNLVNEAKKYLLDKNGVEPTIAELSDFTKLTTEELEDILVMVQKAEVKKH